MSEKKKDDQLHFQKSVNKLCKTLLYPSETDAEISAVFFPETADSSYKKALRSGGYAVSGNYSEQGAEAFFERVVKDRPWHGSKEKSVAERFRKLRSLMENELEDLVLIKIGKIKIDVYLLGRTPEGNIAGLTTYVVET